MLLPVKTSISSKGRLLDLSKPIIMGILNATPDSFFTRQGGDIDGILKNAEMMLKQGAKILDIGGASTKPGQPLIDADIELQRVLPVIEAIRSRFPEAWLSIDTYNSKTAVETVAAGIDIVNDVSGGRFDGGMIDTVATLGVPYVTMHMQGTPETMQRSPEYYDVTTEVREYLRLLTDRCRAAGIKDIIIDPGFGFGKTTEHNYQLLREMHTLRMLGLPILAGISRKSMICKALHVNPDHALNGTTALHVLALQQGASILRVHDVREANEVIKLMEWYAG